MEENCCYGHPWLSHCRVNNEWLVFFDTVKMDDNFHKIRAVCGHPKEENIDLFNSLESKNINDEYL